jgi:hypothetical protein
MLFHRAVEGPAEADLTGTALVGPAAADQPGTAHLRDSLALIYLAPRSSRTGFSREGVLSGMVRWSERPHECRAASSKLCLSLRTCDHEPHPSITRLRAC